MHILNNIRRTNWIQGQELGRKFKAIVTHDGKLNQVGSYGTEELWFIQQDQNGTIWDNRDNYERWDPLNYAKNFSTPQFVVHNDLDYRLPIAEGIMLFNILQSLGVPSRFLHFPDEGHVSSFWIQSLPLPEETSPLCSTCLKELVTLLALKQAMVTL